MSNNQPIINKILKDFVKNTSSIQASAVMTRDGLLIASNLHDSVDGNRLSAISASLLSLADRATRDLHQGEMNQILIDNSDGFILMLKVGENAVLSVLSTRNAKLGRLLHDAKKSALMLANLI
jgi:uncharacterized protein